MFKPRPMQQEVLKYRGGKMGVAAVPGSGKTQTLSYLAALLIGEEYVSPDQEVLVVTLVNSAVDNFTHRIESFIAKSGALPGMGYRVRTLHGLAHDIVRERPDLAGLPNQFQIIDEVEAESILREVVIAWLRAHPEFIEEYGNPDFDHYRNYRLQTSWQDLVADIAGSFIRQAKDLQAAPSDIEHALQELKTEQPLLRLGYEIYSDYQRALNYRGAVDFDDLIRLALRTLRTDREYLERLRMRWPYILEDEAQDSSRLQEEILRLLAGDNGNWVRVGDPNQAIFETFTTANPKFLLDFMDEPDVLRRELPNSGRSTQSIINLANYLIHWTRLEHPNLSLRGALNLPEIHPTPAGDPQPNPHDRPECIHLFGKKFKPDDELRTIVGSVKNWLRDHPDETAAVLVPRNERGARLVEGLKSAGVEVVELLRSSLSTRQTAGLLTAALRCLADPSNQQKLASLYIELTRPDDQDNPEYKAFVQAVAKMLRKCSRLEEFLYPRPDQDWLADQQAQGVDESVIAELETLREKMVRWHTAALLPIDQLILTIAQDAFYTPAELALAHKLALVMERTAQSHPEWHLEEFTDELDNVARNRRKFLGFAEEDTGFDPDQHKGKVAVATVHKAKGLEWDRVYLMSVNNYDFPSGDEYDQFMSEKYFVRNRLNLPEECLMRLKALMSGDLPGVYLEEGEATLAARSDYAAERLRLLYVAITRARKELVLTWNHGKNNDCLQARPFIALQAYWEQTTDVPQP